MHHGFLVPINSGRIVIHFHGMSSNFYDGLDPVFCSMLEKSGFGLLAINSRGHDTISSISNTKNKNMTGGTAFEKFEDSLKDVKAAVDFAAGMGFSEIVLCGHSTGCQKIAYYQGKSQDKRIKGIILLAPADDYNIMKKMFGGKLQDIVNTARGNKKNLLPPRMIKNQFFSGERFLSVAEPSMAEAMTFNYDSRMEIFRKIMCPVLAGFGSKEQHATKPVKEHLEILRKCSSSQKFDSFIIKDANHNFTGKEKELAEEIRRWLVTL